MRAEKCAERRYLGRSVALLLEVVVASVQLAQVLDVGRRLLDGVVDLLRVHVLRLQVVQIPAGRRPVVVAQVAMRRRTRDAARRQHVRLLTRRPQVAVQDLRRSILQGKAVSITQNKATRSISLLAFLH